MEVSPPRRRGCGPLPAVGRGHHGVDCLAIGRRVPFVAQTRISEPRMTLRAALSQSFWRWGIMVSSRKSISASPHTK